jgi:hypothetical protein
MAFCPKCRGVIDAQDKFCRHCGARRALASRPLGAEFPSAHAIGAGHWDECPTCHGTEAVPCPRCSGDARTGASWSGRDPCPVCKGKMRVKCSNLECQKGRVWIRD